MVAGSRDNCPLSHSVPAFWQSSPQSLKDHCCAQCRGTAALPSTAFALPLSSPFPTITLETKERTISWLLGRAECDLFSFAPSRSEALQPWFTSGPASSSLACWCSQLLLVAPRLGDAGSGPSPGCCSGPGVWPVPSAESAARLGFARALRGQHCHCSTTARPNSGVLSCRAPPLLSPTLINLCIQVNFFFISPSLLVIGIHRASVTQALL